MGLAFFDFFYLFAIFFVAVLAAGIVALVTRSPGRSSMVFFGVLSVGVLGFVWICFSSDPYIRNPVARESVTGTYIITDSASREVLRRLGYRDFSGSVTLKPDGTFSGLRIPFCCVCGKAEEEDKSKVDYCDLKARWKLTTGDNGITTVEFSDIAVLRSGAHETGEWYPGAPHLSVTRGHPTGLAFSVLTSGDFYDVEFSRPEK